MLDTQRPVTIALVGAGQRGQMYCDFALKNPGLARVVAVAELRPIRRKRFAAAHNIPESMVFTNAYDLHARGRIADVAFICTLDNLHAEFVALFSQLGYHIMCEKPMATTIGDCVSMIKNVQSSGSLFGVCHVLRYSPYNRAVKQVIDSGALGDIINIQHMEPVGNQHFAHSYVRGNWRKEGDATFSLMAKCCHDLDIVAYYMSSRPVKRLSSFGSLSHFKPSRKPAAAGQATRCTDCAHEMQCSWSAKKIYVDPLTNGGSEMDWALGVFDAETIDVATITEKLRTGAYGRCVYESDNDVVDHQVVNIEYEDGATATLTMSAFTESECFRKTVIQGTEGELVGDMTSFVSPTRKFQNSSLSLTVFDFITRNKKTFSPVAESHDLGHGGGHGGSDIGFTRAMIDAVATGSQDKLGVTPESILDSHLLVFASEAARLQGQVVDFPKYKRDALQGKIAHVPEAQMQNTKPANDW